LDQPAVLPIHTAVPGRARFSVAGLKRNDRVRRALEAGLAGRGIRSVTASTATGTVLVLFESGHDIVGITRRLGEVAERALDPATPDPNTARAAWHAIDADKVIGAVESDRLGLSEAEAKARLLATGGNAIPPSSISTKFPRPPRDTPAPKSMPQSRARCTQPTPRKRRCRRSMCSMQLDRLYRFRPRGPKR